MSNDAPSRLQGRGYGHNVPNRFESTHIAPDPDPQPAPAADLEDPDTPRTLPLTQFLADRSRTIIATNDSPDIPFAASINAYRGCEHGCIYCYARPTHEYLGMSAGLDFESKILVKYEAPELLREALLRPKYRPQLIAMSGVTDCYQPIERKLQLTRRLLEVLLDFRNPVGLITKNHLVTRDLDLLTQLRQFNCIQVHLSITTLDASLTRIMEPRTSTPARRLDAIRQLAAAGIPVGVMVGPVVPALTDHELPAILAAAKEAGASSAGFTPLRLPFAVKELFMTWLDQHFPDRKQKILHRIQSLRGGKLNDPHHTSRMQGEGPWAEHLAQTFKLHALRLGLNQEKSLLTTAHFRRPIQPGDQLKMFS